MNMNFWFSFIQEEANKLLRKSSMFPFFNWNPGKHTIVIKQQTTFLESSWGRFLGIQSHSGILCNEKKEI